VALAADILFFVKPKQRLYSIGFNTGANFAERTHMEDGSSECTNRK